MKKFIALIYCLCFYFQVFSQDSSSSGQIKIYETFQLPKGSTEFLKNKITFCPGCIPIGDYSVFYERLLISNFSIEASIGFTYENFFYYTIDDWYTSSSNSLVQLTYQIGNTYSIAPKFYFRLHDSFDGLYMSIYLRHRLYNSKAVGDSFRDFKTPIPLYTKINTATINFGYSYNISDVVIDGYIGLGIRSTESTQAEPIYNTNNNNYNTQYEAISTKSIVPTGVCCMRIGLAF